MPPAGEITGVTVAGSVASFSRLMTCWRTKL